MSEQSLQDGMESGSKVTGHDLDKTKEERRKERRKMEKKKRRMEKKKRRMERTKNRESE